MMVKYILTALLFCSISLQAQDKKPIEHEDVHRWKKIDQAQLSKDGQWAVWTQVPVTEGDASTHIWNASTGSTMVFQRASEAKFSDDSKWLIFKIKPALDTLKSLRRKKVKEEDLPGDTLGIYDLVNGRLETIARLRNVSVPEQWNGWLAYQIEPEKPAKIPVATQDTTARTGPDSLAAPLPKVPKNTSKSGKKPKKEDKEQGYRLIIRNLATAFQDTIGYVKEYVLAEKRPYVLLYTTGKGDTMTVAYNPKAAQNGLYLLDLSRFALQEIHLGKGKFKHLSLDEQGGQAAFLADLDTTAARIRPWQLGYWETKMDAAQMIADPQSKFLPNTPTAWGISEHARPVFSDDFSKLYFGIAPDPILPDTSRLKEEIVSVEVWAWNDPRLYTQAESRLESDRKKSYSVVYSPRAKSFAVLGSPAVPDVRFSPKRNASWALGINEEPYTQYITSEGTAHKDLYAINLNNGANKQIIKDLRCDPRLSPLGGYILWWSDPDTAWFAYNTQNTQTLRLTHAGLSAFYDVENDVPDYPNPYGLGGWLEGEQSVLLYDQYDIWKIDPNGSRKAQRLTDGRASQTTYRYLRLDPEEETIPYDATILLHQFNHDTKAEGYTWLNLSSGQITPWMSGDYAFSKSPKKAKKAEKLLFTQENYQTFPDLWTVDYGTKGKSKNAAPSPAQRISTANPQQTEYQWGRIESVEWISLDGQTIRGMLVKPEDFDPSKQYPMIVNFYEKLSDDLNRHRSPDFHRSQINFTVYASRGYLVFAPDIPYKTGYPGESAFNAIVSGVTSLIAKGFVDPKRVALQGHSWGGYQAAYLVTRTNLFACAEAGAPVANMTSAYGGVRWESGLNRAFQYERQQSRIGGSLWEKPKQYVENSPLFSLDKVETPLLILHNDQDGAVPWYQGIELFSGLRRLGKPAWLLNYNDEPHWPVKLQNRVDFHRRMQQFFDHYLLEGPEPSWMKRGVPPMEKGILQGY